MTLPAPDARMALTPLLPATEIPLGLGVGQKTLRGFSRAAHSLADRLLISPKPNLNHMLAQAQSNPDRFASRGRLSGERGLAARWSAAILVAESGQEAALIAFLRSNAPLRPSESEYMSGHLEARTRSDLGRLAERLDASQELLSALACANIPSYTNNGTLLIALNAFTRLERPLEALKNLNSKANFARGLEMLWMHPFESFMICLAQAPNLPDLARCGLLDASTWHLPALPRLDPNAPEERRGGVAFFEATLMGDGPQFLDHHGARNIAMMARAFNHRGLVSLSWLAEFFLYAARSCPQHEALHAQVALMTFESLPTPLMGRAVFLQAFESRELALSLPMERHTYPSAKASRL